MDVILIAAVAGFAASAIQAGVQGAKLGQALKAGLIGAAVGAAGGAIGAAVLYTVTPALTAAVAGASGVGPGTAQSIVSGTLFAGSLAQASIGLTQGDYTGIIGLGVTIGIGLAWQSQGAYEGRVLFQEEIDELDALYYDRTPPDWYQVTIDNQGGLSGRGYTIGNSIHLSGDFRMGPIGAGSEQFVTLAHEAAHVVDYAADFAGTLAGGLSDQAKYMYGIDVYNPRISGAGLSSYSVEGRATLYEWAYRAYYPQVSYGPSNFPLTPGSTTQLYDTLYP